MSVDNLDSIVEDLIRVHTIVHRHLLRISPEHILLGISRPHFAIMGVLDESGKLPVSTIGKLLLIPKPQMTLLTDKLIKLGLVERLPDASDRRKINISLTDRGKLVLEEARVQIGDNIRQKLSGLNTEEVKELALSLRKLREVGSKIGQPTAI